MSPSSQKTKQATLSDKEMGNIQRSLELAKQYYEGGQLPEAEVLCKKIISQFLEQPVANQLLGLIEYRRGQYETAATYIRRTIDNRPDWPDAHNNLGVVLRHQGKFQDAIAHFQKALSLRTNFPEALNNLGLAYQALNQLDHATQCYQKAIKIQPNNAETHRNLGDIFRLQTHFMESVNQYQAAIELNPNNFESQFNLGVSLQSLEQLETAVVAYRNATIIEPKRIEGFVNLGAALHQLNNIEEAISSYKTALELGHNSAELRCNLGAAFQLKGRFTEALQMHQEAVRLDPGHVSAYNNLGTVLWEMGRNNNLRGDEPLTGNPMTEAVQVFQKSIALSPDDPTLHFNLGNAYDELGNLKEAARSYLRAITLQPNYDEAWHNLKHVVKAIQFTAGADDTTRNQIQSILEPVQKHAMQCAMLEFYLGCFESKLSEKIYERTLSILPPKANERVQVTRPRNSTESPSVLSDKMVALFHFGRSGTGLFHSLLDGHPELSTIPSIYLRGFFNKSVWQHLSEKGWTQLPEKFVEEFSVLFDANSGRTTPGPCAEDSAFLGKKEGMATVGSNRKEVLTVDKSKFCAEATRLLSNHDFVDPRIFLNIVHSAFEKAIGTETLKRTIFYHIHNPDDFAKLNFLRYFPDARLIMMVREPIECCEAWCRPAYRMNNYSVVAHQIVALLYNIDQICFRKFDAVGIRLEDLRTQPKQTLQSVCDWLGIETDPCLFKMTAQGKKWWGDPTSPDYNDKEAMAPFGSNSSRRQTGIIFSEKDQFILRTLFYPFNVRFGYQKTDIDAFRKNLRKIRPMFDDLLDFEKLMIRNSSVSQEVFQKSSAFAVLRASLIERWSILMEHMDYPHMIKPLIYPN